MTQPGTPIYLDYNATTPVDPRVVEVMTRVLSETFGNPSSSHAYGLAAQAVVDHARGQVAQLLGCRPREVIFTSGGTESDNLAILGVLAASLAGRQHVVSTTVEHPAVEKALEHHEASGGSVTRVAVGPDGRVSAVDVIAALQPDTALVTVMHANNETGAINPLAEIGAATRARGSVLHTDAAQSAGKISTHVGELGVDLLTIAGHKIYAPKGIGALYVRAGTPLTNISFGGGQERGLRPGTESVAAQAGLGQACADAANELTVRTQHMRAMRNRLHKRLLAAIPDLHLNGPDEERLPNTLNVSFPGTTADDILCRVPEIATSGGSACHTGDPRPSPVLTAMGVPAPLALAALRLTIGKDTGQASIDKAAELLIAAVHAARSTLAGS